MTLPERSHQTPSPLSASASARMIHAALLFGIVLFWGIAWYTGDTIAIPVAALPDRKVLYISLFLVSATLFGAAAFTAGRLPTRPLALTADEWWRRNLGRAVVVWTLVETPAILGTIAYLLTKDFRSLLAPFIGLLLFVNYRPSRFLIER
ncbi:MAG: hypothetical protein H0W67_00150 [Gemmatimonadales bacterium]|nr:hypothetical protein [Gemmatimonadales bacterium]